MNHSFPELEPLLEKVAELCGEKSAVILYGSRARGDHEAWSDYDVLLLSGSDVRSEAPFYRCVRDLRLDLQFVLFGEYQARLESWLKGKQDGGVKGRKALSRAEVGMSVCALDGICLAGESHFEPFRAMRNRWVKEGLATDPAWLRFVSIDDGLTDSQRAVIGVLRKQLKRSALVASAAAKDGVAGASFLYRMLVKMIQPWISRYPLIKGQGNFGSRSGLRSAAMRYTECGASSKLRFGHAFVETVDPAKLLAVAKAMESLAEEEEVTPQRVTLAVSSIIGDEIGYQPLIFPHLLANGTIGLPGVTSAIPSFWLPSLCDALELATTTASASDDALLDALGSPDLACGGSIVNQDEVRAALLSGQGTLRVMASHKIVDATSQTGQAIAITSLPPGVAGWDLEEELSRARKAGELPGAKKVKDESCLELGFRLEIPVTKKANVEELLQRVSQLPTMSAEVAIDLTIVRDGKPTGVSQAELVRHNVERRLTRLGSKKAALEEIAGLRLLDDQPRRMS